ncbi:MAG: DUF1501 domain-containing protein [Deltaproteobacteria bacterium]|nr:DUF1501 domain-containing protein [Deltaproteobacteria bacterium]
MKRRNFIKTAAGTGLAAGAGVFGILKYPRGANAAGWGTWPEDRADLLMPEQLRPQSILELTFHGGITPWETFYTKPGWGVNNNTYLHLFEDEPDGINNPVSVYDDICGYQNERTTEFQPDGIGDPVYLGPWTWPLKNRPDILSRMRILVQRHTTLAHEGANPIAFTGDSLGSARMAGLGAPIQRYFTEQPGGNRAVPYSYVLFPGGVGFTGNVNSVSSIGFHPGSARPLSVTVSPTSQLATLLARPGLAGSDPVAFDSAVSHYVQAYQNRFRPGGVGQAARSLERSNFEFANFAKQNANELTAVLPPELFQSIQGQTCLNGPAGFAPEVEDMPRMVANLARSLLTRQENRARYVNWIDTGLFPRPAEFGYDVHNDHTYFTSRSVTHTLDVLQSIIADADDPNPDPELININETMICINMEFGRTPDRQAPGSLGTNHHPYGYVNVIIGGPVQPNDAASPGASVYGHITEDIGYAEEWVSPTENRIMLLSALGIYPFTSQSYAVSNVQGATDEIGALEHVRDILWGINV